MICPVEWPDLGGASATDGTATGTEDAQIERRAGQLGSWRVEPARGGRSSGEGFSCLDGALLASRFLSLMLLRGGLGAVMSPALMRGTL